MFVLHQPLPSYAETVSNLTQNTVFLGSTGLVQAAPAVGASDHLVLSPGTYEGNVCFAGATNLTVESGQGAATVSVVGSIVARRTSHVSLRGLTMTKRNEAPGVFAGFDGTLAAAAQAFALAGQVTEDQLVSATPFTYWSKVSGPSPVAFANSNAAQTLVTFGSAGVYVLRLTADDGEFLRSDELQVTVASTGLVQDGLLYQWIDQAQTTNEWTSTLPASDVTQAWTFALGTIPEPVSGSGLGISQAYRFTGASEALLAAPMGALSPYGTFELWIKPASLTGGKQVIFKTGGDFKGISLTLWTNVLRMAVKRNAENSNQDPGIVLSHTLAPSNLVDFLQVVMVMSNGSSKLFVNPVSKTTPGAPVQSGGGADWSATANNALGGANGNLGAGNTTASSAWNTSSFTHFAGLIGLVRVYNRALSNTEVATNHASSLSLATLDLDGNGLPDLWEQFYFGATGTVTGAASADPDGDGFSTRDEYVAGTHPTNGLSRFVLAGASTESVSVDSVIGRRYQVDAATSLQPPDWQPFTNATGTGASLLLPLPPGGDAHFFRVAVDVQP